MSNRSGLGAAALAGWIVACGHAAPLRTPGAAPPLPGTGAPRPFAALYRLDCCHQSNLLATIRGDGEHLALSVAAGPAGIVVEAWLEPEAGSLRNGGERCVRSLPSGLLPLAGGATVPLDPALAAMLLGGIVPTNARPSPRRPGWFETETSGLVASWLVENGVVSRVEVSRPGEGQVRLAVGLAEHHGRVPGRLTFRAGDQSGVLRLVEWRSAAPPVRPAWMSAPRCEERR